MQEWLFGKAVRPGRGFKGRVNSDTYEELSQLPVKSGHGNRRKAVESSV